MAGWDVQRAASAVLDAESSRTDRVPLTDEWPELDGRLDLAYAVQDELLGRKLAAGQVRTGVKLGLTARAKQRQMNVTSPLTGFLTDAMVLPAGEPVPQDELIHPRVEPEIVFVLGRPLLGPGVTAATALAAVERVHGGIEVIDSRYRDFRFTLADVVADNASSARFVLGPVGRRPEDLDLALEACLLEVDGVVVDSATGAAVQGHPAQALALAANTLGARGITLEPGWLVLTGGLTPAVTIEPGTTVAAHFTSLGTVHLSGG
jgi:2-oxo-3-hexenedioate decarboxylase